jgi:uncharacterized protein (DUF433 family)
LAWATAASAIDGAALRLSGCTLDGMERFDRITIEPGKMGGQPCIRGHRLTVEHLLTLVGAGWTLEEIQADFLVPDLVRPRALVGVL